MGSRKLTQFFIIVFVGIFFGTNVFPLIGKANSRLPIDALNEKSGIVVDVGSAEGKAGESVDIPVSFTKNSGIASMGFSVIYDKTMLSLKHRLRKY